MDILHKAAIKMVESEVTRIREQEGFSADHDKVYSNDELAMSAAAYAVGPTHRKALKIMDLPETTPPAYWPFPEEWYKPAVPESQQARLRETIKATALLVCELVRQLSLMPVPTESDK